MEVWVSNSYDMNRVISETIEWSKGTNKILYHSVVQDWVRSRFPNMFQQQIPLFITVKDNTIEKIQYVDNCTICMEDKDTTWTCLPCNHWFHTHCLNRWVQTSATCPLCRNKCSSFFRDKL